MIVENWGSQRNSEAVSEEWTAASMGGGSVCGGGDDSLMT